MFHPQVQGPSCAGAAGSLARFVLDMRLHCAARFFAALGKA
jgi:hypothetical protein